VHSALISSDRVNGTDVYDPSGNKVGTVDHLMIDKQSGKVAYAVIGFGGFLGLGEEHYPLPWHALDYDPSVDGYRTNVTEARIKSAPPYKESAWSDRSWETRLHDHYASDYYWLQKPVK